jgi:protein-tyrosine phosphatase
MIDLHSHILPGIDDGAKDLEMSLAMARMAVEDGTTQIACTPHFMPGVYDNTIPAITNIISGLEAAFRDHDISLNLIRGGDIHIAPEIADGLAHGILPTIGESNYFLFEPPHHVLPPGIVKLCEGIMDAGFIPVLTHPERLSWIENHYDVICQLDKLGVVVQLTAGSITGSFGKRALYWSERMLDEGRVDIIASDAHNIRSRPPGLSRARCYRHPVG